MTDKSTAKAKIADLIDMYNGLSPAKRKALGEMDTRRIFILPLFDALGWDTTGNPDEVVEEVSGIIGRADYAFRIGGISCFLLEAKPIHVNIDKPQHAVQAVSYAYNRGVPWALLSDFEGIKVYYAELEVDHVTHCQVMDLHYNEYLDEFDLLWMISKPAFQLDLLRKYAERRYGAVPRRIPVGDHILAQFVGWRESLFKYFWQYNHDRGYSLPQIDEAIQRLLDRLIFIRTCEDRHIEEPRLLPLLRAREGGALKTDIWNALLELFREFDATYDSRLFERHLLDGLACEETPFRSIIEGLYFSAGPVRYQFDVIPADVLGRVYEQYLGFVAQTAKEVAKREAAQAALPGFEPAPDRTIELVAKKLKRKEHGIYYTPQFVVDYIVEQTLGQILTDRPLDEIENLAVLDMACGSGSFLITAYEHLLRYHAEIQQQPELPQQERLNILTKNIYGVDLDAQAVEVAQLNLLLKALETPGNLPNLNSNIKRGNSLIEGGEKELEPYFGKNWRTTARPLNWRRTFTKVMKRGGFDVIIGNPPYVRIQTLPEADKLYYNDNYQAATGNYDIYTLFVERGWQLLRLGGVLGLILPHRFFKTSYGEGLREFIAKHQNVQEILDFDGYMVFEDASINTCILVISKEQQDKFKFGQVNFTQPPAIGISGVLQKAQQTDQRRDEDIVIGKLKQEGLTKNPWIFVFPDEGSLWQRLDSSELRLKNIATQIFQGLKTGGDPVFSLTVVEEKKETTRVLCSLDDNEYELENSILKPLVKGSEIKRYHIRKTKRRVLFPYKEGGLIPADNLQSSYPLTWEYLSKHRSYLESREREKMKNSNWYGYTRNQALNTMWRAKILTPEYYAYASYCYDKEGSFYFFGGGAGGYGIVLNPGIEPCYVLGLINSKLLDWYLHKISVRAFQTAYLYVKRYIERLPIHRIDFDNPVQVAQHDAVVTNVEELLRLYAQRIELPETDEQAAVQAAIEAEETALNRLIYELYELSEDEVTLVENSQ